MPPLLARRRSRGTSLARKLQPVPRHTSRAVDAVDGQQRCRLLCYKVSSGRRQARPLQTHTCRFYDPIASRVLSGVNK